MKLAAYAFVLALLVSASSRGSDEVMRVHIVDVCQANAALVEFPNGVMLIDAGGESANEFDGSKNLMKYLRKFFDRRQDLKNREHPIDLFAITHPHKGHMKAIPEIIDEYPPDDVIHNH